MQANLVVLSGAAADVPGQFGAASMTAAMLDEGAAGKAALALADEVEFLGAQLSTAAVLRRVGGADVDAGREAAPTRSTCWPMWRSRPTSPPRSSSGCAPSG